MKEIEQRMHNKIALMPILAFTYSTHKKKGTNRRERESEWERKPEIKMSMKFLDVEKKAAEMSELLNNSFA